MSQPHSRSASAPPRRAAWVLLVVFLLGHTPLLPAWAGLVAAVEGGHAVQFSRTRSGVTLTLHHVGCGGPVRKPGHSAAARCITGMAADRGQGASDHVIEFPVDDSGGPPWQLTPPGQPAHGQRGFGRSPDQPLILARYRVRKPCSARPGDAADGQIGTMLQTVRMVV